jgi:hypothetical protein
MGHAFVFCQDLIIEMKDIPPEIREHIRPEESGIRGEAIGVFPRGKLLSRH